jgi:hypothetical protein
MNSKAGATRPKVDKWEGLHQTKKLLKSSGNNRAQQSPGTGEGISKSRMTRH